MKRTLLAILALMLVMPSTAQNRRSEPNYELAARFSQEKLNKMVFSTSATANWFKNSDKFWYEWKTSEGTQYYIVDPVAKTKKPVFDMDRLAMQLTEIVKDPFDAKHIPFQKLKLEDDSRFTFDITSTIKVEKKKDDKDAKVEDGKDPQRPPMRGRRGGNKENKVFHFEYDINSGKLTDVTDNEQEKDFPLWACMSPDGTKAVYCKNYDLYWMTGDDVQKLRKDDKDSTVVDHRITFDGTRDCFYSGSNYRAEEVKDTTERRGAMVYWSPDSRYFVTQKFDLSNLQELWVINSVAHPRPTLQSYRYQMPGEPGNREWLYLFDTRDGYSHKVIKTDAFKDQSLDVLSAPRKNRDRYDDWRKIVWLGDNSKFYFTRQSRDMKRVDVCEVPVDGDSVNVVIEERLNTYVEMRNLRVINGGKDLVWWSERNGWGHLYLYGADGTFKNAITSGAYHVEDVLGIDEAARVVYFLAMGMNKEESPYNGHLCRINLDGTGFRQIDLDNYNSVRPSISDDNRYIVSNYSRVDATPKMALYSTAGQKMDLEEADLSKLFEAGYKFPEPFKVKAADGVTDLIGYMYKPYDFDSTKVYPIIDYVYPGPQVEGNFESWSKNMVRTDRLAQIGFIVITCGNRGGHPNRSKWYHNYGYGNLRDYGLADQKYAIQQLAARHKFIDINRVGIHGHSGGGFMSTAAILKYPDFFKVAVSCSGNHDNSIYNRWWSETHHGVLEEVTAQGDTTFKYSIDKNQDIARNLKGHLMLVTGDIDDNVHPANTLRVVDALVRANKRFDMLVLPGQRHGYGDMNEYFFWRMADYYSEWLLGRSQRGIVDITQLNNDL